jgi:hypothetical protein
MLDVAGESDPPPWNREGDAAQTSGGKLAYSRASRSSARWMSSAVG